jgi:hypothetical protein
MINTFGIMSFFPLHPELSLGTFIIFADQITIWLHLILNTQLHFVKICNQSEEIKIFIGGNFEQTLAFIMELFRLLLFH